LPARRILFWKWETTYATPKIMLEMNESVLLCAEYSPSPRQCF
jgi:hypothetical protein